MQDKFSKLNKKDSDRLLKLMKAEHGNITAICKITMLSNKTVKAVANGQMARTETIERIRPILFI